jgi:hypothetical protein
MKNLILIVLCGALACAPAEGPQTASSQTDPDSGSVPALLPTARPTPLPQLSLRTFHDTASVLDSIQVMRGGRLVQTLVTGGDDMDPAPSPGEDVDTVDINFDGYTDIRQQTIWGATGNAAYSWWLFDPDSSRFVRSREYEEKIWRHSVDRAKREITVHANGGHAGLIYEEYVYQPRGGQLVRIRSVQQDAIMGTETYVRVKGRLEGERWVEESDTLTFQVLRAEQDSIAEALPDGR